MTWHSSMHNMQLASPLATGARAMPMHGKMHHVRHLANTQLHVGLAGGPQTRAAGLWC